MIGGMESQGSLGWKEPFRDIWSKAPAISRDVSNKNKVAQGPIQPDCESLISLKMCTMTQVETWMVNTRVLSCFTNAAGCGQQLHVKSQQLRLLHANYTLQVWEEM